jgi:hypothetical protein
MPRRNSPIVRPNVDEEHLVPYWGEYKAYLQNSFLSGVPVQLASLAAAWKIHSKEAAF